MGSGMSREEGDTFFSLGSSTRVFMGAWGSYAVFPLAVDWLVGIEC